MNPEQQKYKALFESAQRENKKLVKDIKEVAIRKGLFEDGKGFNKDGKKLIKQVFKSNNDVNELIKEIIDAERDSDNKK